MDLKYNKSIQMQLARIRPIAYEDNEELLTELNYAGKKYCDLIEKIIDESHPEIIQGTTCALAPETQLLLQVQGTEIVAAACANLNTKVVYAANQMLIDRINIVLDTCHHIKAVNNERQILNCLFRQVNATFAVGGSLGDMLFKGYTLWDRLRSRIMRKIRREQRNLQHRNPVVRILLRMCHENTSRCSEYEAAKLRMAEMEIERVEVCTTRARLPRFPVSAPYPKHRIMLFRR